MNQVIKILDVIALLRDLPGTGLKMGQVGTVVEIFDNEMFEVEFVDKLGRTTAMLPIHKNDLLLLQYEMEMASH